MSQWHRYGHMDKVFVKAGDRVKKGQLIGTIGDGNGQWKGAAHVHYDCPNKVLTPWYSFPIGQTKAKISGDYTSPYLFIDKKKDLPTHWDHLGYDYLQPAVYSTGKTFHPGCDINGKGGGNADFGQPIYSVCDGTVVFCYAGVEKNHGWGKLMVIEESQPFISVIGSDSEVKTVAPEPPKTVEKPTPVEIAPEASKNEDSQTEPEPTPHTPVPVESLYQRVLRLVLAFFFPQRLP